MRQLFLRDYLTEFKWDCVNLNLFSAEKDFIKAYKNAKEAGKRLATLVIDLPGNVILSGFSLGAVIVLSCLKHLKDQSKIKFVFLFGAAFRTNKFMPVVDTQTHFTRINYHSKYFDYVLKIPFAVFRRHNAAGEKGLFHPNGFLNCKTSCTHNTSKFWNTSYSRLVPAVLDICLFNLGLYKGQAPVKFPWQVPLALLTSPGWDNVYESGEYIFQYNIISKHYRVIKRKWPHKELCWSKELGAILQFIATQ